jgi:membrane-associated phospholipid phosphatase
MTELLSLLTVTAAVVGGAALTTAVATATMVGRAGLEQFARNVRTAPRQTIAPFALLGGALLFNKFVRDVSPELSQVVGWNVTGLIYAVEGPFVAVVQSIATPTTTAVMAVAYLPGYVFLLTFPLIAYASLPTPRWLKPLALGISLNYVLGLVLYTLFISYGPRNLLPGLVEPLLYRAYPRTQLLTSQVNTNTNVFPSLHTSLSVTVALFAHRSRHVYPRWYRIAVPLAATVVVSTMYLGIHWGIDVVAGVALGVLCVRVANWWW